MVAETLNFEASEKPAENGRAEPTPGDTPKRRGRPPGSGNKPKLETQLRDELTMFLKFGAMMWSVRDPHCGPVLNEIAADVAADAAKFAARSKWASKWLSKAVDVGDLVSFFMKLQPLLSAIYDHHIAPAINRRPGMTEETENAGYGVMG